MKLVELAMGGDLAAIKLLLDKMIGRPADALDADKLVEKIIVRDYFQEIFATKVLELGDGQSKSEARNRALDLLSAEDFETT